MLRYWFVALLAAQTAQQPRFPQLDLPKQTASPEPPKPEEPPPKPVLIYQGKPLKLPFTCGDEDIATFGLTCTPDEPCDAFLELAAVEALPTRIFATGNVHTSSVTLWSVLLASEDNGITWTEAHERIRSSGLEQIQFFDLEAGWIGGEQMLALPRDPFLLISRDGGKTWRKKAIHSEPRVGAIEQFNFESRTTGALVVDRTQTGDSGGRHEYYETTTGGESWALRQVSPRPIALRRPRVPNPDWRVRADGPSQSYRVERKSGERWQTVAAFLVKVGECKPAEIKLEPPPEPEEPKPEEAKPSAPRQGSPPSLKKKAPPSKKPG
jgi:hypothetical protein